MSVPTVRLNNGMAIPTIGLGTLQLSPNVAKQVIMDAIDYGYRLFDCAYIYENEFQIGEGFRAKILDGTVTRKELFICTKVWNTFHSPSAVYQSCLDALKVYDLAYIDLYLIHWPMGFEESTKIIPIENGKIAFSDVDYLDTWSGLEKCLRDGLVKGIGVSNFSESQLSRLIDKSFTLPVINQIECNPHIDQKRMIEFCKSFGIVVMAYSPLERGLKIRIGSITPLLEEPLLVDLEYKYKKTICQIILRYLIQLGTIPIPKTVNKRRLKENIEVFNFMITPEDMQDISTLNYNLRHYAFIETKHHPHYPFIIQLTGK